MTSDDQISLSPKTLALVTAVFLGSTVGGGGASVILSPSQEIQKQTEKLTKIDVKLDMALGQIGDHEARLRRMEASSSECKQQITELRESLGRQWKEIRRR